MYRLRHEHYIHLLPGMPLTWYVVDASVIIQDSHITCDIVYRQCADDHFIKPKLGLVPDNLKQYLHTIMSQTFTKSVSCISER